MKKWLLGLFVFLGLGFLALGYACFKVFSSACSNGVPTEMRVRSNWDLHKLSLELKQAVGLKEPAVFEFIIQKLGYSKVKPCFITIPANASIYDIAKILETNRNQTRNVVIKGGWDAKMIATSVSDNLEVSYDSFTQFLQTSTEGNGELLPFNDTTWPSFFIPNTYNFYVADNLYIFMKRMQAEKAKFWNAERTKLAEKQGLKPYQVSIIASIVTKESNKVVEYENIAGVYINRLRIGMLLQADPTVVFARGKGGRVWAADLRIHSPYNTYIHKGLPPGPICIPNAAAYEAVLHYTHHDFIYFCAKEDFSGSHNFAATLAEHTANARKFHQALNKRNQK